MVRVKPVATIPQLPTMLTLNHGHAISLIGLMESEAPDQLDAPNQFKSQLETCKIARDELELMIPNLTIAFALETKQIMPTLWHQFNSIYSKRLNASAS